VIATGASIGVLKRSGMLPGAPEFGRAARAYVEGLEGQSDAIEFHLEAVPLPGYGWVFPTSPTTANIGAGTVGLSLAATAPSSPRAVYEGFVNSPHMGPRLRAARTLSPVKGYPLRVDFPIARLADPGRGVVGEAAGLVNPLTGEGIDYALESAHTTADVLSDGLRRGLPADQLAQRYAKALRDRFQQTFVTIQRVRDLYLRPWVLDRAARVAVRHEDYRAALVNVCMGNLAPGSMFGLKMLFRLAAG
jgi:flavin-dependent dehydrogenase